MSDKAIKKYFDIKYGPYCGLLLEKRLAIRVQKLLHKQTQELKELIAANIDETEIRRWTLAYPDDEQVGVDFFDPTKTREDKINRLQVLDKTNMISPKDEVFKAESMEDAEKKYLAYHDKLEFLRDRGE